MLGLETFGNEEQKKKYLTPLAQGRKDNALYIGAFLLSEPEAGSDATSQQTTAEDKGDHYLLNGTKNWITNGSTASTYIVMAQTDAEKGHKGINAFIVEKGWAGFEIGPKEKKMGIRGSDTHSLIFNDVKVPKENLVDGVRDPFRQLEVFGTAPFTAPTLQSLGADSPASCKLGFVQGDFFVKLKHVHRFSPG